MKDNIRYFEQDKRDEPQLLDTKVNPPPSGSNPVPRPGLLKKLDKGLSCKLTIVTAAAGYGKSALLVGWIDADKKPAAWLTLEPEDNDVVRFWSYFFHAIKNVQFHLGKKAADYLHVSGPFQIEKVLNIFINELTREKGKLIIILDDFHVIDDKKIYTTLKYLLDHMPHNFHIYLVGRTSPSLPLASLRAKDKMMEIKTNDLRFTLEEARVFFKKKLKFSLSRLELKNVHRSMEGWAAGLQMVSLLPNSFSDKRLLFKDLSGTHPLIMDYFTEEVLGQQADKVKSFLLQTSVLEKMNGSLCNALTGRNDGHEMLELLEKFNLFTFSLDYKHNWYRYHHLFAEALRAIANKKEPGCIKVLHQKAYKWFEKNGFLPEAIHHALKAEDFTAAAEWIEQEAPRLFKTGELTALLQWISALPEEMLYRRPKIWLYYIWVLNITGNIEMANSSCEELFAFTQDKNKISLVEDKSSQSFIKSEVDFIRCGVAFYQGKSNVIEDYKKAIQNMQKGSLLADGMVRFNAYSTSLLQGSLGLYGRLHFADLFFSSTESAIEKVCKDFPSFAFGYALVSEIRYEQNNLQAAEKYAKTSLEIGKKDVDWGVLIPAYIILTNIGIARGQLNTADELWGTLESNLEKLDLYQWISIYNAFKARLSIKKDDRKAVNSWIESGEFSIKDEINILQYFQFITLARALLYKGNSREACVLIDKIVPLLEERGGIGRQIETRLLQAICFRALNKLDRALIVLEQAAVMGLQEGYCRIFIDEGDALLRLLQLLMVQLQHYPDSSRKELRQYVDNICELIATESLIADSKQIHQMAATLTSREWEVLRLVSEGCTNREIAKALFISLPTVNTHLTNIFRKFNVNSRTKAIAVLKEIEYLR